VANETFDNADDGVDAVVTRQRPRDGSTDNHALVALQEGVSGLGHALKAKSENPDAPTVLIQGAGPLVQFKRDDGTVVGEIGNDGSFGGLVADTLTVADRLTVGGFTLPQHYAGRKPPYRDPTTIVSHFQTSHGWTTSGSITSSDLNDTTDFVKGTQSAKVVFSGNGNLDLSGISPTLDLSDKAIRFLVKVDDVSKLSQLNIKFGTNASNCYTWQTAATNGTNTRYQSGEWTPVTVSFADIHSAAGTHTLSANRVPAITSGFSFIRFQVIATGGDCTVHFQSVELIDHISATFPNGVVSVVFDDSWDSQYTLARPKMDAYGYRSTNYTIVEQVGQSGRMTLAQLRSMQDNSGHEIAGHAYTINLHDNRLTSGTALQVDDEMRNLRSWLVTNGFGGESYAYPGGNFEQTTDGQNIERIVQRYFNSGRTILSTYGSATNILKETWPPTQPMRMLALSAIGDYPGTGGMDDPTNIVAAGGILDVTKRLGAWLILTFHVITSGTGAADTECSVGAFDTILGAINSYGIPVLPVSDVMRYVN
jgi:peptidoglycan/xylan/chitin deacetylase (PgdA/CDA1 family)